MANFCKCGADEYVCQVCGKVRCSGNCSEGMPSEWMKIPGKGFSGNVCLECILNIDNQVWELQHKKSN